MTEHEELVLRRRDAELVANDIQGYLDGDWDGNRDGWQALVSRLRSIPEPPSDRIGDELMTKTTTAYDVETLVLDVLIEIRPHNHLDKTGLRGQLIRGLTRLEQVILAQPRLAEPLVELFDLEEHPILGKDGALLVYFFMLRDRIFDDWEPTFESPYYNTIEGHRARIQARRLITAAAQAASAIPPSRGGGGFVDARRD